MNQGFYLIFDAGIRSKLQPEPQIRAALRRIFQLDDQALSRLDPAGALPLPSGTDQAGALEYLGYLHKLGLKVRLESPAANVSTNKPIHPEETDITRTQLNLLRAEALMESYPNDPTDD